MKKEDYKYSNGERMDKIKVLLEKGASVLVVGETGTGKTTILNTLGDLIPNDKKTLIVKDLAGEINIEREDKVYYIDEDDEILFEKILRSDPEVLVYNELYPSESNEFINVLRLGTHGLTTLHSKSASEAIDRLVSFMPEELSMKDKLRRITDAFDLIITAEIVADGEYLARRISEVKKLNKELKASEDGELYVETLDI